VDAWQWAPDLIWFDNLRSFGTPSYYVQKVFGNQAGTRVLPVSIDGDTAAAKDGLYTGAALDERANEFVVKVVNAGLSAALADRAATPARSMRNVQRALRRCSMIFRASAI
jgi:alpha-N-arabinofuranosidase